MYQNLKNAFAIQTNITYIFVWNLDGMWLRLRLQSSKKIIPAIFQQANRLANTYANQQDLIKNFPSIFFSCYRRSIANPSHSGFVNESECNGFETNLKHTHQLKIHIAFLPVHDTFNSYETTDEMSLAPHWIASVWIRCIMAAGARRKKNCIGKKLAKNDLSFNNFSKS